MLATLPWLPTISSRWFLVMSRCFAQPQPAAPWTLSRWTSVMGDLPFRCEQIRWLLRSTLGSRSSCHMPLPFEIRERRGGHFSQLPRRSHTHWLGAGVAGEALRRLRPGPQCRCSRPERLLRWNCARRAMLQRWLHWVVSAAGRGVEDLQLLAPHERWHMPKRGLHAEAWHLLRGMRRERLCLPVVACLKPPRAVVKLQLLRMPRQRRIRSWLHKRHAGCVDKPHWTPLKPRLCLTGYCAGF